MRRVISSLCVAILLLCACPLSSSAKLWYSGEKLSLITEPESFSAEVACYCGEETIASDDLTWVDNGYEGKALKLSGDGTFLRLPYTFVQVPQFTFAAWVNWQGGESGQRLFTVARATENYLTFSPFNYSRDIVDEQGFLNGLHLEYQYGGEGGKIVNMFNATDDTVCYALPENAWHHVAVVTDARSLKVYIDGILWLEEQVLMGLAELRAYSLDIGMGEWGDPTLNALLDNVEIYRAALSEERIKELAGVAEGPENTVYLPTKPAATTTTTTTTAAATVTTTARETVSQTAFGMPLWGLYFIGGVVLLYIAATVAVNIPQWKKKKEDDT